MRKKRKKIKKKNYKVIKIRRKNNLKSKKHK